MPHVMRPHNPARSFEAVKRRSVTRIVAAFGRANWLRRVELGRIATALSPGAKVLNRRHRASADASLPAAGIERRRHSASRHFAERRKRSHILRPVHGSGVTPFRLNASVTRGSNKDRSRCGKCGVGREDPRPPTAPHGPSARWPRDDWETRIPRRLQWPAFRGCRSCERSSGHARLVCMVVGRI